MRDIINYTCIITENIELKDGQITMKGFIQLNQMEAEDNEGDTADLWVTLSSMGFNKNLVVDEVSLFYTSHQFLDLRGRQAF